MSTGTEMWTYLLGYFDGKQNNKTKSINMSITSGKLQNARSKAGASVEGHMVYRFNLRERLVTLGATVDDYQMNRFMMNSLPNTHRFQMLQNQVELAMDHVDIWTVHSMQKLWLNIREVHVARLSRGHQGDVSRQEKEKACTRR